MRKANDASDEFLRVFQNEKKMIVDSMSAEPVELQNIKEIMMQLQRKTSEATNYLSPYDVEKYMKELSVLQEQLLSLEPKRPKFAFKSSKTKKKAAVESLFSDESPSDDKSKSLALAQVYVSPNTYEISQSCNRVIIPATTKTDFTLDGIDGCIIILTHLVPTSLFLKNITNSIIVCHTISGSLYCELVSNTLISASCRQLRIHHTHRAHFYAQVESNAIIEDSNQVAFGPFPFLDGCAVPKVDDFNWLQRTQSPNWKYIDSTLDWPQCREHALNEQAGSCLVDDSFEEEQVAAVRDGFLASIVSLN